MLRRFWYPWKSLEFWGVANISFSWWQWMYFYRLYVLPCWLLSQSVRGEMSEAARARKRVRTVKLSEAMCRLLGRVKNERASYRKRRIYIDNHVTWPAPNARFIFVRDKIKMRVRNWKHTVHDYSVQAGSRNYLIYRRLTTFVSGTNESWILFF